MKLNVIYIDNRKSVAKPTTSPPLSQIEHAVALHKQGRIADAKTIYEALLKINAKNFNALHLLGVVAYQTQNNQLAVDLIGQAIEIDRNFPDAYSNRGNALKELRQLDASIASFDRAIALKPDYAEAYWNKSLVLLLKGDFENGLPLYEWRWQRAERNADEPECARPLWLGVESLLDKSILICSEQGLGDTIQFIRYAKSLAGQGARVIAQIPASLLELLKGVEGVSDWIVKGDPKPDVDYYCPLLSLPLAFKTNVSTIPCKQSYLRSDRDKVEQWHQTLGAKRQPRVGIVWSGAKEHKKDRYRSLELSMLLDYLPGGIEYVSLQKEVRDQDAGMIMAQSNLRHFGSELHDFSDTAALCELMDLVISVDTSVAHLSGALGRPTWILLPYVPDWRWLLDREDSPWYASVKLYRQTEDRQWAGVLERIRSDLRGVVRG